MAAKASKIVGNCLFRTALCLPKQKTKAKTTNKEGLGDVRWPFGPHLTLNLPCYSLSLALFCEVAFFWLLFSMLSFCFSSSSHIPTCNLSFSTCPLSNRLLPVPFLTCHSPSSLALTCEGVKVGNNCHMLPSLPVTKLRLQETCTLEVVKNPIKFGRMTLVPILSCEK